MYCRIPSLILLAAFVGSAAPPRKAFPPPLQGTQTLWRNPGQVEAKDMVDGSGGRGLRPVGPFTFVKEDPSGTTPKVTIRDARGRVWSAKWGEEVHSDVFASRLAWAVGYVTEATYYVPQGIILGVEHKSLKRAGKYIGPQGEFREARLQLRSQPDKFLKDYNWSWSYNPFMGTPQLDGLKIMVLLTSNWDNKDARDEDGGNTGIYQHISGRNQSFLYFIQDWGASMGRWGHAATRSKWDCIGYDDESRHFVKGVKDGFVDWGYSGKHTNDATRNIPIAHVQWLMQYLGRITDRQIVMALRASGATEGEEACYLRSVRQRINQLQSLR